MLPQIGDADDQIVRILREIRDATQGVALPGQADAQTNRPQTRLRVHDVAGKFSPPENAVNLANQEWEDDRLTDLSFDALDPGETEVVARMLSTDPTVYVAVKGVATTEHVADVDGDGKMESVVTYEFEYQTHEGGDSWNTLAGMNSTLPVGYLGTPVEIIPGEFIGPMSGFRIRFHNTSDGTSNPTTVAKDDLGGQIAAIIIRTED